MVLAVAAILGVSNCASVPARPSKEDPDVAWVCGQHDLLSDLRGRITFEDVQRTICYLGEYGGRMNLPALFAGALGEASGCAPTPGSRLDTNPAPTTIRELYVDLKTASTERQPHECVNAALIKGMLRPLGPEYRYHPIGEEQPKNAPEPPVASSLRAHGKTLLIGRRTRGLAPVDTVIDLPSGSRLVVPIGDLLDTQGGTISGRGVQPDIDLSSNPPLHDGESVDDGIRLAVQVFSATRSGTRADLLDAAHRIVAASVTAK